MFALRYPPISWPTSVAVSLLCVTGAVLAQEAVPASPNTSAKPADINSARDALQTKDGDVSQAALLKETLSAAEKQYSLLKTGQMAVTYDLTYSYVGSETINAKFTDSSLTLFNIQNVRAHTVTNTGSVDYGLLDNVTGSVAVPLVSRYSDSTTFAGHTSGLGDVSLGLRIQPMVFRRDGPTFTLSTNLRLPTGRSPYTSIVGQNLSTGAGTAALSLGTNVSQVLDPVALFGSLTYTVNAAAKNISQQRDNLVLVEVKPGASVGLGVGVAYALSYKVSTTVSVQETVSARSKLRFADGTSSQTATQTSGALNLGLGLRISPKTTVNVTVGIGLTRDSPDMTLGMNMPLAF